MSWANLDDGFADHPKVIDLPDAAFRLEVCAMCWCARRLTDGLVRSRELRILGAMLEGCPDDEQLRELVKKLVKARLWIPCEEGWRLHNWLKHNQSASTVIERREAAKQRMAENRRKAAEKSRTFADSSREQETEHAPERASEVHPPYPILSSPNPNPTEEAKASSFAVGHAPPPHPVGLSGQSRPRQESQQGALIPEALAGPKQAPERSREPRKARAAKDSPEATARTNPVWEAYSAAFLQRHRTEPTRNMRVNIDLGRLIDRIGAADAPAVAAFYVRHPAAFYVGQLHPVWALLKDAEKLHAEWRRGQVQTMTEARQREQTSSNAAFRELERRRLARAAAATETVLLRVEDDDENRGR